MQQKKYILFHPNEGYFYKILKALLFYKIILAAISYSLNYKMF